MSLVFEYAALEAEMLAFARSARAGATRAGLDGIDGISQAVTNLKQIGVRDNKAMARWTQSDWAPIRTTVSEGAFMPSGGGGVHVLAKLSFVWEIRNFGEFRRRAGFRRFELAGNVSTRVDIVEEDTPDKVIAMWRFEVASHDGPGCHFHTQILGDDSVTEGKLFPHAVDIPRLPGFLVTPTDALEFVLGELFQDAWGDRDSDQSPDVLVWRDHQKARLTRVLEWQRETIGKAMGSPWIALKRERPKANLLFDNTSGR